MAIKKKIGLKAVGLWNPRIFQPDWFVSNLSQIFEGLTTDEIVTEVSLGELILLFTVRGIVITPKSDALTIETAVVNDPIKIGQCVKTFKVILEILSHTPLVAIGINVDYEVGHAEDTRFIKFLASVYRTEFDSFKAVHFQSKSPDGDYVKNILLKSVEDPYNVQINFHYQAASFKAAWLNKGREDIITTHFSESEEMLA
jgi:hypothetical protein